MNLEQFLNKIINWATTEGIKLIIGLLLLWIGWKLAKKVVNIMSKTLEKRNVDATVSSFLDTFVEVVLKGIVIYIFLDYVGIKTTGIAALVASAGVAIGLALQGSLSNFAGGVLILLLKPFEVGDYIIEDTNHNEGTVKEIQIFYTKLSTVDNKTIVIPNGMLTNNSLTNATAKAERKLDLKVDIAYEADLRKAKAVIEEIIRQDDATIKNEEILVFVHELAESSVVIGARAWVKNEDYWNARWRILEEIKLKLDENEIEMAYPHLTVQMGKEN